MPAPPNRSTPLYQLTAGYEWRGTETVGMSGVGTGGVVAGDEVDETVAIPINHSCCCVAPSTLCWTLQIHPAGERESGSQRQKERERQTDRDRDEERERGTEAPTCSLPAPESRQRPRHYQSATPQVGQTLWGSLVRPWVSLEPQATALLCLQVCAA